MCRENSNPLFVMQPENQHALYVASQEETLRKLFPLLAKEEYSIRTVGVGDGHGPLIDTIDRFISQDEWGGVVLPSIHPFSRSADAELGNKPLMDHIALDMLLQGSEQRALRKIHKVFTTSRVEARFAFIEGKTEKGLDHIQTVGAERSSGTGGWFLKRYDYYRGVSRQYKPKLLSFLPLKIEED